MILHVNPASPWWMHAAAGTALVLHVGGGSLGLVSGTVALVARKGGRLHRLAGNVFFLSMLTMAAIAAIVAPLLSQSANTLGGVFTFYLVATAWVTVRRRPGSVGRFEIAAMLVGWGCVAMGLWFGSRGAGSTPSGQPTEGAYVVAAVALLAAVSDLRVLRQGGIAGVDRIARHVWRMCVGLFVAAGSFFLGQQQVFPEFLRGSPILALPVAATLAAMLFWLIRIRFGDTFRKPVAAA